MTCFQYSKKTEETLGRDSRVGCAHKWLYSGVSVHVCGAMVHPLLERQSGAGRRQDGGAVLRPWPCCTAGGPASWGRQRRRRREAAAPGSSAEVRKLAKN